MDPVHVRKLYEAMHAAGFSRLDVQLGEHDRVRLVLDRQASSASDPVAVPSSTRDMPPLAVPLTSERVGVFAFPKKPVAVGSQVKADQILGIIRGISMQDQVAAPFPGEIISILVQEGQIVEFGQPLFVLMPTS